MTWREITNRYQELQLKHGEPSLDSIISGGKDNNPEICFIFMNPTGRNIASNKSWTSLKSPWIGTKNIWKVLYQTQLLDNNLFLETQKRKPTDWDYTFTELVYRNLEERGVYITNLAKCTQLDARPLPNKVFKDYRSLLLEELELVRPKKIVTFGNQVSSIFLEEPISVSKDRKKIFQIHIYNKDIPVSPVYYPVGQGQRNIQFSIEDINWFLNEFSYSSETVL